MIVSKRPRLVSDLWQILSDHETKAHNLPRQSQQPSARRTPKARCDEMVKHISYLRIDEGCELNFCISFWPRHKQIVSFEKVLFYQVSYRGQHFEIVLQREQDWCITEHKHFKILIGYNLFFFLSVAGKYVPLLFDN